MTDPYLMGLQLKIDKERYYVEQLLESGKLTEKMLVNLMNQDDNYGNMPNDEETPLEEAALKEIFNAPFLLCDQPHLSDNIKKLLPVFLERIYKLNRAHLKFKYDCGDITGNEYSRGVQVLKYITYESSEDGKNIKKNGLCVGIDDYVLKLK